MINFYKYEGVGNDFIMVNNLKGNIFISPEKIKKICDRHFGIGADGVILLEKSDKADCFMNYYNSDGTLAEMCGNGIRCTAQFYLEQTKKDNNELYIDTRAGIKKIICNNDDTYSVNMGKPIFEHQDFPSAISPTYGQMINIEGLDLNFISMGNPHAVAFVNNLSDCNINSIGPKIENNKIFPNKINVEFVEKISPARNASSISDAGGNDYYKVKVWERGCGETLSCGTGACAVYAILNYVRQDLTQDKNEEITLEFPGGKLYLSKNHEGEIVLRGPATFVFKEEII